MKIANLRIITRQLAFSIIVVTIPSVYHLKFLPKQEEEEKRHQEDEEEDSSSEMPVSHPWRIIHED